MVRSSHWTAQIDRTTFSGLKLCHFEVATPEYIALKTQSSTMDRTPSCPLESLPTDALIAVMSAVDLSSDLKALIHASPIVYRSFLVARASILICVIRNDLGPVLRDALMLLYTKTLSRLDSEYDSVLDNAVCQYRRLLSGPCSEKNINSEIAIKIIQLNRVVQYFVDLYSTSRLSFLRQMNPKCGRPASDNERRHITQAIFRSQTMIKLYGGWNPEQRTQHDPNDIIARKLVDLFRPWEIQQIAEASAFTWSVCLYLGKKDGKMDDALKAGYVPNNPEEPSFILDYSCDLPHLRRIMLYITSKDHPFEIELNLHRVQPRLPFLAQSHRIDGGRYCYSPNDPNEQMPTSFADDSTILAPYGWVDAHDGWNRNQWGDSLLLQRHLGLVPKRSLEEGRDMFNLWRWLSFVFWDRDRVEMMKETHYVFRDRERVGGETTCYFYDPDNGRKKTKAVTDGYPTGWLSSIWD